jgi:hypothetical protein
MRKGIGEGTSRIRGGNADEGIRTSFIVGLLHSCSTGSSRIMANKREYRQTENRVSIGRWRDEKPRRYAWVFGWL